MSYGLMVYAVDLAVLRSIVGSKEKEAFDVAHAGFSRAAARVDATIRDRWIEPNPPTPDDILRQLIDGSARDARLGSAYAYALEHLCDTYGQFLDNRAWSPIGVAFVSHVQAALDVAGLKREELPIYDLIFGGTPISIELVDEFPALGFWEKPVLANAAAVLATVNFAALPADVQGPLRALADWVRQCEASARTLVCFCY